MFGLHSTQNGGETCMMDACSFQPLGQEMIDSYSQGFHGSPPSPASDLDWSRAVGKPSAALVMDFPPTIRDALAAMGISPSMNAADALFGAARGGNAEAAGLLAKAPFSPAIIFLAIKAAAAEGAATCVKTLLLKVPAGSCAPDALVAAVKAGSSECVELLAPFSDPDARYEAIRVAAREGRASCLTILARRIGSDQAAEALFVCVHNDQPACARIILGAISGEPGLPFSERNELLVYSATRGHAELLGDLLDLHIDGENLIGALRFAAERGRLACLRMLMAKTQMREADIPALLVATDSDHVDCAAELLPLIKDTSNFWSALRVATRRGSVLCAKHFISMLPPPASALGRASWRSSAPEGSPLALTMRPSSRGFHSFAETARGHGHQELSTFFAALAEQEALCEAVPATVFSSHSPRL